MVKYGETHWLIKYAQGMLVPISLAVLSAIVATYLDVRELKRDLAAVVTSNNTEIESLKVLSVKNQERLFNIELELARHGWKIETPSAEGGHN